MPVDFATASRLADPDDVAVPRPADAVASVAGRRGCLLSGGHRRTTSGPLTGQLCGVAGPRTSSTSTEVEALAKVASAADETLVEAASTADEAVTKTAPTADEALATVAFTADDAVTKMVMSFIPRPRRPCNLHLSRP